MSLLILSILVTVTWLLWVVAGAMGVLADKLEHKRPENAGFSIAPAIPFCPLFAIGAAYLFDKLIPPWGTRVVGGFHVLLMLVFVVGIIHEVRRVRALPPSVRQ